LHYEIFYGNILCKALRPISEGTGKFIAAAEKYLEWEEIMAQLWGGRFVGETDKTAYEFNASIRFDKRLFKEDIEGSIAHVTMLAKQGILTEEERDSILQGLAEIRDDVLTGRLVIDDVCEDIHSFVEARLIERTKDVGKKLHTGRSRNDQVALDMRLYTRKQVRETDTLLKELLTVILTVMEENLDTYMPGFTHLQKAQPTTLAHHYGAYFEMFRRDRERMADIYRRMNYCPLGAGALAGTTYDLDREYTAFLLGFTGPTRNSMDSVSDRDYLIEFLAALSTVMMHLSRFSEEIINWNSNEYQFVEIDDAYSTGSSIMPQKKNPDIAELVRGKTGRVYGALVSLLTVMKGIPLAYNKDMQEDKELAFDAMDTVRNCLTLFTGMLRTMRFKKEHMAASAMNGFTNATDAADYLVGKGVPFRDAHGIVGRLVLYCVEKNTSIEKLSLEELQNISDYFGADIYEAVSLKTCVEKRLTLGAPGIAAMKAMIEQCRAYLMESDYLMEA
jgi:argininosuccinate lyase